MDDERTRRIAEAFDRLFRTYPQSDRGDVAEVARERIERARVYFDAVAPYELRDIEAAVESFITGNAPGVNHNFVPPAPSVASEVRRLMNRRLESEERTKRFRPALPPPLIQHSAESRGRVKAMVDGLVQQVALKTEAEDAVETQRRKSLLQRTNERFYPSMDERAMKRRLGFEAGDADGEADAA